MPRTAQALSIVTLVRGFAFSVCSMSIVRLVTLACPAGFALREEPQDDPSVSDPVDPSDLSDPSEPRSQWRSQDTSHRLWPTADDETGALCNDGLDNDDGEPDRSDASCPLADCGEPSNYLTTDICNSAMPENHGARVCETYPHSNQAPGNQEPVWMYVEPLRLWRRPSYYIRAAPSMFIIVRQLWGQLIGSRRLVWMLNVLLQLVLKEHAEKFVCEMLIALAIRCAGQRY